MSMEPRVRYQAQWYSLIWREWTDAGEPEKDVESAKANLSGSMVDSRILKTTTTFEVVEEMEPKV